MEATKKLIVAADDYGLTPSVNEAIAAACLRGIVTAASLLVTTPGFESAVAIARRERRLDIGLHLDLTEGQPVTSGPALPTLAARDAFLYNHPLRLAAALARGRVRAVDLEREIRAQIEKALGSGLPITHIDGHKHVHVLPAVRRIVLRVAPEYGIAAIRATRERVPRLISLFSRHRGSRRQLFKQYASGRIISACWWVAASESADPLLTPDRFYGITQTGFLDREAFNDIIGDVTGGVHELMCHPGYVDDALRNIPTRLREQRERELELLTGTDARKALEQAGITLINYRTFVEEYGKRRPSPVLHRHSAL